MSATSDRRRLNRARQMRAKRNRSPNDQDHDVVRLLCLRACERENVERRTAKVPVAKIAEIGIAHTDIAAAAAAVAVAHIQYINDSDNDDVNRTTCAQQVNFFAALCAQRSAAQRHFL